MSKMKKSVLFNEGYHDVNRDAQTLHAPTHSSRKLQEPKTATEPSDHIGKMMKVPTCRALGSDCILRGKQSKASRKSRGITEEENR